MPSQKSTQAVPPKRQRGRERVAAILDAAAQLFVEQGQAVTMTEIAARSGTAIGSLYRFFPTREALIAVLLERYAEHLRAALTSLQARAPALDPEALANDLLALATDLKLERAAALALLDHTEDDALRQQLRTEMHQGVAAILTGAGIAPGDAPAVATAVILVIKAAGTLAMQPDSAPALAELHRMLRGYLAERVAPLSSD